MLATGESIQICLNAAEELPKYEIMPKVASVAIIQPLDGTSVLKLCQYHPTDFFVCEEYSINGELREAITRLLIEHSIAYRLVSLGIPNELIWNGS